MRCLSLTQPWAWSMMFGPKLVENRTWKCPDHMIGEVFAMHASAKWDADGERFLLGEGVLIPERGSPKYAKSAIIGVQCIVRCVEYAAWEQGASADGVPEDQENFFFGPYGFVMDPEKRRPITPIPHPGALSFFNLPDDIAAEVARRVTEPYDFLPAPAHPQTAMPWEPPGGLKRRRGRK